MITAEMKKELTRKANKVERFLSYYLTAWPGVPARLRDAMLYSLEAGGKRIRPALCLATASLCGLAEDKAVPFAAAIEMVHTYSLIHDDLPAMDNDDLRRGKPSNHKQFDEATAILAGDGLLTDAFAIAATTPVPASQLLAALAELAKAAGSRGMVGGQMLDMQYTGKSGVTIEDVAQMQSLKTGAMLESACLCGALLAGAPHYLLTALQTYGASLGKAFQIADDILDITGNAEQLGKPVGNDAESGKNTYPSILGLEESRRIARIETETAQQALPANVPEAEFLRCLADYAVSRSC